MSKIKFAGAPAQCAADVVIVGAGISGLYCAYRLVEQDRQQGTSRRITVIERLNRTGGRLDTDLIEIKPGEIVREEEGGMRFQYSMTELMQLTKALGLCEQIVDFPMASSVGTPPANTNRFLLRGHSFTAAEAEAGGHKIWSTIYDLKADEKGKSPTDIVMQAYNAVLKESGWKPPQEQTPDFWTKFREQATWRGVTVNQWQMWGLLRDMGRSEECVEMLSESIGFAGPFKAPINAGDAFQILADFPKDPQYHTFRDGFSTLPNAVESTFPDSVQVLLGTNVNSIRRDGEGFQLTLTEAPQGQNSNPHVPGGETKKVTAPQLILAVATKGMEQLFITSPALNQGPGAQKLWDNIHSARGMKLMKINLYFDQPWWQNGTIEPPVQFGPNFSTLPINSIYPFYSLQEGAAAALSAEENTQNKAAALTIYCDFNNTNFWAGLQNVGDLFDSPLQKKQTQKMPQTLYAASKKVVAEAKRQLGQVFALADVPEPVLTSYRLWNGMGDFEYAYHQWRLGVVDTDVRTYLSQPMKGVHFCNEAISDMQGWVNGAIRSSNAALKHFGIEPMANDPCMPPQAAPKAAPKPRVSGPWG
jgi:monoamine oxidase